MSRLATCAALLATLLLPASLAGEEDPPRITLLTWEGYTAPLLVEAFEERTGCKLDAVFVGAEHDFTVRLIGGNDGDFDLVSPSLDMAELLAELGVVEPLNSAWLSHWADVPASFRDHPGVRAEGTVWAMPFAWGALGLLYRTDKIDPPPISYAALWDSRYSGRVALLDDKSTLYAAARLKFGDDAAVYDLSDAELLDLQSALVSQKALLRDYWSSTSELIDLFAYGDVWLSDGSEIAARRLQAQGMPVALRLPDGRASGWADAWQIVRGADNLDCVYEWLNFVLSPDGQCRIFDVTGYAPVNPKALADCPAAARRDGIDRLGWLDRIDLARLPARPGRYTEVWNAIKAIAP